MPEIVTTGTPFTFNGTGYTTISGFATSTITTGNAAFTWAPTAAVTTFAAPRGYTYYATPTITPPEATQEERDAWAAEQERLREQCRRQDQERVTAREHAEALLLSVLDEVQAASYRQTQGFEVVGSHGGRYRINWGTAGNVYALAPDGDFVGALCCHPCGGLPVPDVMLAQALHLMSDEPDFVRTANVHRGHRPAIGAVAA
jgi:hypothetical protein